MAHSVARTSMGALFPDRDKIRAEESELRKVWQGLSGQKDAAHIFKFLAKLTRGARLGGQAERVR
jgi:hypothetical protein